jgi:hypothetical protein
MSFAFFPTFILPHLRSFQAVNLQCLGEPLLNKDFMPMSTACKSVGCHVTFTTNGVLLKQSAEAVVEAGADEVTVSIDGVRSMKEIRDVGSDRVVEAIGAVVQAKARCRRRSPSLAVNSILTRQTLPELVELVEMVGRRGVSKIALLHLGIDDPSLVERSILPVYDEALPIFRQAQALRTVTGRISCCLPHRGQGRSAFSPSGP